MTLPILLTQSEKVLYMQKKRRIQCMRKHQVNIYFKERIQGVTSWGKINLKYLVGLCIIIAAIYLKSTTLYFDITHFNQVYEVIIHLQNVQQTQGESELNNAVNNILATN